MKRASKFFTDYEKTRIKNAVTDAEAKTSAEIIPVVATASGRYDRAEDMAGLWLGLVALAAAWFALREQSAEAADWGSVWGRSELPVLIASVVIGFVIGTVGANYITSVRRLFIPKKQLREEVKVAAAHAFFDRRVHHTEGATGLLVYVSLFERTARILADQTVLDALSQDGLDKLGKELVDGIVAGDTATSICEVIRMAGERLGELLPRGDDDVNEHPDTLVLLD